MKNASDNLDRLIVMGVVSGAHGVRGDVRVRSFTEDPEEIFAYGPLLDANGKPVLDAAKARPGNDHFIVTPKTARQKEEWDALKGTLLHVPRSRLPAPNDDEFYVEDLAGLSVTDEQGEAIGLVKSVQNFGAGDLLEIAPHATDAPAYFVPFTLEDVPEVSFEAGTVMVRNAEAWADQSDPRRDNGEEGGEDA